MLSTIVIYKTQLKNQNDHIDLTPIDVVDLGHESVIEVDLKPFWSSVSNKY